MLPQLFLSTVLVILEVLRLGEARCFFFGFGIVTELLKVGRLVDWLQLVLMQVDKKKKTPSVNNILSSCST
ncbi:hypothetical protein F5Y14DRAFT_417603 [Nemania sp. NC0429]|nr:hypothetical protein F5Y14DRAFT_417603 [Nemania sp. NC0429]